jgi:ribose 5-phosphate isomerase B
MPRWLAGLRHAVCALDRVDGQRKGAARPVTAGTFKVIFGADDTNECVIAVREYLRASYETSVMDPTSWPELSEAVARGVAGGEFRFGVLMCWTGTGTAMAANKVPGVRAAQAWEPWIATNARLWNDANVLAMSLKRTAPDVALDCVRAFLAVESPDPEELPQIEKMRGR